VPHHSRTLRRVETTDAYTAGFVRKAKICIGIIAAHPFDKLRAGSCKKRKDGAPSVGMVQCKDGPPALVSPVILS
jgi:hypothetical protein